MRCIECSAFTSEPDRVCRPCQNRLICEGRLWETYDLPRGRTVAAEIRSLRKKRGMWDLDPEMWEHPEPKNLDPGIHGDPVLSHKHRRVSNAVWAKDAERRAENRSRWIQSRMGK